MIQPALIDLKRQKNLKCEVKRDFVFINGNAIACLIMHYMSFIIPIVCTRILIILIITNILHGQCGDLIVDWEWCVDGCTA